jgi:hypothetical protein
MIAEDISSSSITLEKQKSMLVWSLLAVAAIAFYAIYANFVQDDAYITYRYARNLANGLGFVYNPGESILGTTTPLYTLLLALITFITHLPIPQISLAINVVSLWIGAGSLFEILKDENFMVGLTAALIFITNPLVPQSVGMESIFLVCLMLLTIRFFIQGRLTVTAILAGLSTLTRYEMIFLLWLLVIMYYFEHREKPLWVWPAFLISAIWMFYALYIFGSPIPLSILAKIASPRIPFAKGAIFYLALLVRQNIFYSVFLFFSLLGCLIVLRHRKATRSGSLLLGWSIIYLLLASLIAGSFPWYYMPLLPGLAWLISKGAEAFSQPLEILTRGLLRQLKILHGGIKPILLGSFICLLLGIQLSFWGKDWHEYRGTIADPRYAPFKQVSDWLLRNASKEQTLATAEIGYLGFLTDMRIVDLSGLVTSGIHPWLRAGTDAALEHALTIYSPDYVLIRKDAKQKETINRDSNYIIESWFQDDQYELYRNR